MGGRPVGVPGVMQRLEQAHREHGLRPWVELFEPASSSPSRVFPSARALSLATSIQTAWGSRIPADGGSGLACGYLLNNPLSDFAFVTRDAAGTPVANRVQPGKRKRSSMGPTLAFERADGQLRLVAGASLVPMIIHSMAKAPLGDLQWGLDVQQAIDLPVFGSIDDSLLLEEGRFPAVTQQAPARAWPRCGPGRGRGRAGDRPATDLPRRQRSARRRRSERGRRRPGSLTVASHGCHGRRAKCSNGPCVRSRRGRRSAIMGLPLPARCASLKAPIRRTIQLQGSHTMTELGDSLERMSFVQLLLLFGFVTCYVLALGGLFGPVVRLRAGGLALLQAAGFVALTDPWVHGALLVIFVVAGLGLFVMASWLLARLLAPPVMPLPPDTQAESASEAAATPSQLQVLRQGEPRSSVPKLGTRRARATR